MLYIPIYSESFNIPVYSERFYMYMYMYSEWFFPPHLSYRFYGRIDYFSFQVIKKIKLTKCKVSIIINDYKIT